MWSFEEDKFHFRCAINCKEEVNVQEAFGVGFHCERCFHDSK